MDTTTPYRDTTTGQDLQQTGAEQVLWDLRELYPGADSPEFRRDLEELLPHAEQFARRWRGRIQELDPEHLTELLQEYEQILERAARLHSYVYLNWSVESHLPQWGALLQRVREVEAQVDRMLVFVVLEWTACPEEIAAQHLQAQSLKRWHYWLSHLRQFRPHLLSEPEEQVLRLTQLTGRSAWVRFFDELHASLLYELDGKPYRQQEILALLYSPDRELRRRAAAAFTQGLRPYIRQLAFIFNTVLAEWHTHMCQLRKYPHWLAPRNLENHISDAAVEALIGAVVERYDLVERYYELKRRLLRVEKLYDWDRYAPLPAHSRQWSWEEAQQSVLQAYAEFSPEFGAIVEQFSRQRWIHAPVVSGKHGGAYCASTVPSVHPYILMNFTGTTHDVLTLAHELGHGIHQYLARVHGILQADAPLTLAETASTFGEMLLFERLLRQADDPTARLALLIDKLDDIIATVFRQVAMNRFEDAIHRHRAQHGELTVEDFSRYWLQTQQQMFRSSLELTEDYGLWWSYIPHLLHVPGYVYAYAFGELLALALYEQYRREGQEMVPRYRELLAAGGSQPPELLLRQFGVEVHSKEFWRQGLEVVERLIAQAEQWSS
jgi:oligoendopeptidase F